MYALSARALSFSLPPDPCCVLPRDFSFLCMKQFESLSYSTAAQRRAGFHPQPPSPPPGPSRKPQYHHTIAIEQRLAQMMYACPHRYVLYRYFSSMDILHCLQHVTLNAAPRCPSSVGNVRTPHNCFKLSCTVPLSALLIVCTPPPPSRSTTYPYLLKMLIFIENIPRIIYFSDMKRIKKN